MATQIEDRPDAKQGYNVGGVTLDKPFRIRRLGHFGIFVNDVDAALKFYCDHLGFNISDPLDFGARMEDKDELAKFKDRVGYFTRHGTDHHSFVVFPKAIMNRLAGSPDWSEVTINQITWQVGSLREVTDAESWLSGRDVRIRRSGRDTPGSNWHCYPIDPEGNINELYYGIEQIGWDGRSKPREMHRRGFHEAPSLPQINEHQEVDDAVRDDIDVASGYRPEVKQESTYDVGGILLPRPFKVTRIGPVRLWTDDVDASTAYYRDRMGLAVTEEVTWNGHRCVFLRANTEHHSMALYPKALRAELGLKPDTSLMAFGMQLGDYSQLRDAVSFLTSRGVEVKRLPPELFPGIDYSAFAIDPDGHAIQLYYYMEQVGWDGRPRPAELRPRIDNDNWPESVESMGDTYAGEAFMGPLG